MKSWYATLMGFAMIAAVSKSSTAVSGTNFADGSFTDALRNTKLPGSSAWKALLEEGPAVSPAPPLPHCMSTPEVPPRSDIQQFNATYMKELTDFFLHTTLGPCQKGPQFPSSTSVSGAFILGGKVTYFNYGCVSKDKPNTAPTEKTIYRLASNSKTFAVETAIQAYAEGKIASFDDELRKYFPDFKIKNPFGTAQPTFRQLMSQLGGIPREGPCVDCNITSSVILQRIAEFNTIMMRPWTRPSYSNLAYSLIGNLIAERLYDKQWGDFLVENIARPLGMNTTGLNYTSTVLSKMVVNYLLDGSVAPFDHLGWLNPAGGVYSTAEDMALWILHYLNEWKEDSSLGELRRNTMLQVFENPGGFTGFGAPWEIFSSSGYLVRTKTGDLPGLTTFTAMVPELDFGLVFLWNGEGIQTIPLGKSLFGSIIPALREQYTQYQENNFPEVSTDFLNQYEGIYHGPGIAAVVNTTWVPIVKNTRVAVIDLEHYGVWMLKPEASTEGGNLSYSFRVFVNRQMVSCYEWEVQADPGEWIYFQTLDDGTRMFRSQYTNFTTSSTN